MRKLFFILCTILTSNSFAQNKQDAFDLMGQISVNPSFRCGMSKCLVSPDENYLVTVIDNSHTFEVYDTKTWIKKGVFSFDEKKHIIFRLAYFQNSDLYIPLQKGSENIDYYFKISLLNNQSEVIKCKNSPAGCVTLYRLKNYEKYYEGTKTTSEGTVANEFYVNGFKLNYMSDKDNCSLEIKKENPSKIAFNNNIEKNTDYKLLGKNSMDKNDFISAIRYYSIALKQNQDDYDINYNLGVCHIINTILLKKEFDEIDKQYNLKSRIPLENTDYFREFKKTVPYFEKANSIKKNADLDKKLLTVYQMVKFGDKTNIYDTKIAELTPKPIVNKNTTSSNSGTTVNIGLGGNSLTIQNFSFSSLFELASKVLGSHSSSSSSSDDESSSSSSSSGSPSRSSASKCVLYSKPDALNNGDLRFNLFDNNGTHQTFKITPLDNGMYQENYSLIQKEKFSTSMCAAKYVMKEYMSRNCPTYKLIEGEFED